MGKMRNNLFLAGPPSANRRELEKYYGVVTSRYTFISRNGKGQKWP